MSLGDRVERLVLSRRVSTMRITLKRRMFIRSGRRVALRWLLFLKSLAFRSPKWKNPTLNLVTRRWCRLLSRWRRILLVQLKGVRRYPCPGSRSLWFPPCLVVIVMFTRNNPAVSASRKHMAQVSLKRPRSDQSMNRMLPGVRVTWITILPRLITRITLRFMIPLLVLGAVLALAVRVCIVRALLRLTSRSMIRRPSDPLILSGRVRLILMRTLALKSDSRLLITLLKNMALIGRCKLLFLVLRLFG